MNLRAFLGVFLLLFNTLSWYYMTLFLVSFIQNDVGLIMSWGFYYVGIIISSIIGTVLSERIKRATIFTIWITAGFLASLSFPLIVKVNTIPLTSTAIFFLGFSVGLGIPSCLAEFADTISIEKRGQAGGFILLLTIISISLVASAFSSINLTIISLISGGWRIFGILSLYALRPKIVMKTAESVEKRVSYYSVFSNKTFVFYLTSWLMFSFIDHFEAPILRLFFEQKVWFFIQLVSPTIGSIFAQIWGYLSDNLGRKKVTIYGFVILGLAYAGLGVAPALPLCWYLYGILNAVAWGNFYVNFVLVLWGDLSDSGGREKYYSVGGTLFFFAGIVELLSSSYLEKIPTYASFSLASLFLFLAVIPLIYAPETLPEKLIRQRELKRYIEKAKRIREKYEKAKD